MNSTPLPATAPARGNAAQSLWFFISVFVLLSACIACLGWFFYVQREKAIKQEKQAELSAIADLKAEEIANWREERLDDARVIMSDPPVTSIFLEKYLRSAKDIALQKTLSARLTRLIELEHYRSAFLLDRDGKQLFAIPGGRTMYREPSVQTLVDSSIANGCIALSDLHKDGTRPNDIYSIMIVPIVPAGAKNARGLGALALDIDPNRFLYPLIQSWPMPSRTAEVLLVRKEGDSVVYLNELRHKKNTALNLRLPLDTTALPAAKAVSGDTGAMEGIDYRRVPVLAVARHIAGTQWFMVAKIDKSEALAAGERLFMRAVLIVVLLICLAGVIIAMVQRHRSSRMYKRMYLAEKEKADLTASLAREKERLFVTLRSIGDGVITTDTNGKITLMNTVAEQLTGFSTSEAFGRRLTEVFHIVNENTRKEHENPVEKVMKSGIVAGLANHTLLISKDGTERIIADSGAPIRDASGAIIGVVLVFRDITKKKRTEKALAESEEKFRRVFEQSSLGKALSDKNNVFVAVNPAFCAMLGYSEQELLKLTFRDITHPDHLKGDAAAVEKLMRGEINVYKTEKKYITKSGGTIYGALTLSSLRDLQGEHQYSLVILENITEKKRAADALAAEKERLSVTLRSIGDAVIATDVSGSIVLMNKVAESLTGWPVAEAEGKPLCDVFKIINELTREPCANPVEKVLKNGAIVTLDNHTVLVNRDGSELVIADSGAPIKDRDSKTIGIVLVFRDNSEKQRTQEAMQKAEQLESLGVLAGGIAHDFNNLLSGLFGYLDLARMSVKGNDEVSRYMEKAFSVFGRAKDLTNQLLTFSKGGAPAKKTLALAPIIRDAVHFALSGSAVKSNFEIAADLWHCDVDENQMSQVLDNIVINARDAMPMGGTITVSAENVTGGSPLPPVLAPGNYVRISVADQGTGISPDHLPRIFDPFFTTKQKGSGLGLATSYSIVKRHGGAIEAESELGKGSTFIIFLPASGKTRAVEQTAGAGAAHKGSGRALVMDDEDFIRDVAAAMLKDMGYSAETAIHGNEAIDMFNKAEREGAPYDLAILDLTIPGGMGGKQARDELRKITPSVKIIASSGYSDDPVMSHPQEYGFDASVRKPYNRAEFARAVESVMKG